MSDKIFLKDITLPIIETGENETYSFVQTDSDLETEGDAADAKKVGDELTQLKADFTQLDETAAKIDGSYDTMTVGNAKQLTSNVGINDKAPYLFRTAGGANDIGDREEDTIVGGSVIHNQLVENGDFSDGTTGWSPYVSANGSIAVSNGTLTYTVAVAGSSGHGFGFQRSLLNRPVIGHKYLYCASVRFSVSGVKAAFEFGGSEPSNVTWQELVANTWTNVVYIVSASMSSNRGFMIKPKGGSLEIGSTMDYRNIMLIDLTAMFGTTIANYVYTLEQATAGAGIAWLKKYGFFTQPYYSYTEPTPKHVEGLSAHKMVGFNQWDEEWEQGAFNTTTGANIAGTSQIRSKNLIPILPQTNYFWKCPYFAWFIFYDANKNVIYPTGTSGDGRSGNSISFLANTPFKTPIDAWYCRFYVGSSYGGTYKNNICLHLYWDGERGIEYEAYKVNTYPLDDSLTLRGIPKLDANNDLYYDGDVYKPDGTVSRRYGILDLGTLDWTYKSEYDYPYFISDQYTLSDAKKVQFNVTYICSKYRAVSQTAATIRSNSGWDKTITLNTGTTANYILVQDLSITTAADLKAALSGQYLVYELATPTTETADPYQTPQVVDDWGTEEYVCTPDSDGVIIPVGHDTFYSANLKAKLEMAPDSPGDGDGDYIVRQTNGLNEYAKLVIPNELPTSPSEDGTYTLKATVADGTATLAWVADT